MHRKVARLILFGFFIAKILPSVCLHWMVRTATGKPYDAAVSCKEKGGTLLYNEAAATATTVAVKTFLTGTFGLK